MLPYVLLHSSTVRLDLLLCETVFTLMITVVANRQVPHIGDSEFNVSGHRYIGAIHGLFPYLESKFGW
jgi:hypothetical protein